MFNSLAKDDNGGREAERASNEPRRSASRTSGERGEPAGRGAPGSGAAAGPPRDDVSFDPALWDREGDPSNTPTQKTISGGEDTLEVQLYVDFREFPKLRDALDAARAAAECGSVGDDEIQLGRERGIVAPGGYRQGQGPKGAWMRWRLRTESGVELGIMNRAESHKTMPNVAVRIGSAALMQHGTDFMWNRARYLVEQLGGKIRSNKLSRVDVCVDLPGVPVEGFVELCRADRFVSRGKKRAMFDEGRKATGYSIGGKQVMLRVYDKLDETKHDALKRALLKANRWGVLPNSATRVEFQMRRGKLKQLGVDSVEDWFEKRATVCEWLTNDWFRLTEGPVDRKHADRAAVHPLWVSVQGLFRDWCGKAGDVELTPLNKTQIDVNQQMKTVVGILVGVYARLGRQIRDNRHFILDVELTIREMISDRDMAEEVARRRRELGME